MEKRCSNVGSPKMLAIRLPACNICYLQKLCDNWCSTGIINVQALKKLSKLRWLKSRVGISIGSSTAVPLCHRVPLYLYGLASINVHARFGQHECTHGLKMALLERRKSKLLHPSVTQVWILSWSISLLNLPLNYDFSFNSQPRHNLSFFSPCMSGSLKS